MKKQFPYCANGQHERHEYVDYGPDDHEFTRTFWRDTGWILLGASASIILAIMAIAHLGQKFGW